MLDRLYSLPEGAILAGAVLSIIGIMATLPLLVRRIPWMKPDDRNTDFVIRSQGTLFTMTSLVLTFTLVQADINNRQADAMVSNEASRIEQLDRLLARYGDPKVTEARSLLRNYATSLVNDEWPVMLSDQRHQATARAFSALSRQLLAVNPTNERQNLVLAEILRALDAVADFRSQRLNFVTTRLPSLYWWVVLLAVAMLLLVSSSIQQTGFRRTILCAQAAVVGGFLGFVFVMDQPFRGESAITPEAITKAIERMAIRMD